MTYALTIRPEAEADLRESYQWYEARGEGLGSSFLVSVEATLNSIQRYPQAYPKVYKNVRRSLIRRFPFGIFYIIRRKKIIVFAVFHGKRNPAAWKSRHDYLTD